MATPVTLQRIMALTAAIAMVPFIDAAPRLRVARSVGAALRLGLPSNATTIRDEGILAETFSCGGRHYGYYADPDNDCQLFHVCLPVQYDDGKESTFKWSFVCPEETIFNQETLTCSRREDAIPCEDSERFYNVNEQLGQTDKDEGVNTAEEIVENEVITTEASDVEHRQTGTTAFLWS